MKKYGLDEFGDLVFFDEDCLDPKFERTKILIKQENNETVKEMIERSSETEFLVPFTLKTGAPIKKENLKFHIEEIEEKLNQIIAESKEHYIQSYLGRLENFGDRIVWTQVISIKGSNRLIRMFDLEYEYISRILEEGRWNGCKSGTRETKLF